MVRSTLMRTVTTRQGPDAGTVALRSRHAASMSIRR
jgi:hypothetical protein